MEKKSETITVRTDKKTKEKFLSVKKELESANRIEGKSESACGEYLIKLGMNEHGKKFHRKGTQHTG